MTSQQPVRWNIFVGIIFSVAGMCLLNYYSLFPEAGKSNIVNNNNNNDKNTN